MKEIEELRQQPLETTISIASEQKRKKCLEKTLPYIQKNIKFLTKKTKRRIARCLDLPSNVADVTLSQMITLENVEELIAEFEEIGVCQTDLEKLGINKDKIIPKKVVKVYGKYPIKYIKIYDMDEVLNLMLYK